MLLRAILFPLLLVTGNMEYFSLYCHSGYHLSSTTVDRTIQGLTKLRCLEACHRHAAIQPWMAGQCKSVSYHPAGRQCVLSPLRLFNPQNVYLAEGWAVCTQKLVLFNYFLNGVANVISADAAVGVCAGLGDSKIATFTQLQYAWDHDWRYCAPGRVSNGSIVMIGNEQCYVPGFTLINPIYDSNVYCVGSRAEIAIHENQRSFAFPFGYMP